MHCVPLASRSPARRSFHGRGCVRALLAIGFIALPIHALAAPLTTAGSLSLSDTIALAVDRTPRLAAQQAAVSAAESQAERASQLPDPQLIAGVDNLPVDGADRFRLTRDFMTMQKIGVMQEFPTREKRRLRGERAEAEVEAETARFTAEALDVRRQAARAWIDRYAAERERVLIEALRPEWDAQIRTAEAVFRGGAGRAADVLASQSARLRLDDRLDDTGREIDEATASLTRWIGADAASRSLADPPDFGTLPQTPATLIASVDRFGALLPYEAMENVAERDIALARAEKKPDWSLEVAYGRRGPEFSDMLSVQVRIGLPLFPGHRQDPAIAAKRAELERIEAEHADAAQQQREALERALAGWQAASRRVERFEKELIALADQRAEVALAAYRGGQGDIQPVLEARTDEIETRLAYVDQLRQRARSWADLRFLIPEEGAP